MNYLITDGWAGRRYIAVKVIRQTKQFSTVELLQDGLIPHLGHKKAGDVIRVRTSNVRGKP